MPVADLDPIRRADWTAEQWSRAEAAGLIALAAAAPDDEAPSSQESQHSREDDDESEMCDPVWWDEEDGCWHTHFPPPPQFGGDEWHDFGHVGYERTLTAEETELVEGDSWHHDRETRIRLAAEHTAYFAALRDEMARPGDGPDEHPPISLRHIRST